jgi:hypothetical protein
MDGSGCSDCFAETMSGKWSDENSRQSLFAVGHFRCWGLQAVVIEERERDRY